MDTLEVFGILFILWTFMEVTLWFKQEHKKSKGWYKMIEEEGEEDNTLMSSKETREFIITVILFISFMSFCGYLIGNA